MARAARSARFSKLLPISRKDIAFAKVDIDANQDLATAAGIQAVPTLMILKQGEVIFQQAGALQAADLDNLIAQAKALDLAAAKAQAQA